MDLGTIEKSKIDIQCREPLSVQLAKIIEKDIISKLEPGTRLPALKKISKAYEVGFGVAQEAFIRLQEQGIIFSRVGIGSFVGNPRETEGVITISYPGDEPVASLCRKLITLYSEQNSDVKITANPIPPAKHAEYLSYISKEDNVPDVAIVQDSEFMDIKPSLLCTVAEDDIKSLKKEHHEGALKLFQKLGIIYGTPFLFSPVVIIYNRNLFDELGISYPALNWSEADFEELIERVTKPSINRQGFCLTNHPNRWINFLMTNDARIMHKNGRPYFDLDDNNMQAGVEQVIAYFRRTPASLHESVLIHGFLQNRVAMLAASYMSTFWQLLKQAENKTVDVGLCPFPKAANQHSILTGAGIVTLKKAKNPCQAKHFRNFLVQEGTQKMIRESGCGIPTHLGAAAGDVLTLENVTIYNYDCYKIVNELQVMGIDRQDFAWRTFLNEMALVWGGLKDVREVVEDQQKAFENASQ